jgi:RNA polymerase sigma-70 factor (ECF subfamily)
VSTRDLTITEAERLALEAGATGAALDMDEETFRAFYDRTSRALWAYLARLTGDRPLADDLLQETYYRLLRADAVYQSEAHRRHALFRIATNLARDAHRRRRLRPVSQAEDAALVAPAVATDARTDVTRALSRLKPRERAMLWLAYAEGASHREIADTMGVRPASVKILLMRARRRLAALLPGFPAPGRGGRS